MLEKSKEDDQQTPYQLIDHGCRTAAKEFQGSATVVAIKLLKDMSMQASNMGDSGYALFHVRPDKTLEMYYRSKS